MEVNPLQSEISNFKSELFSSGYFPPPTATQPHPTLPAEAGAKRGATWEERTESSQQDPSKKKSIKL